MKTYQERYEEAKKGKAVKSLTPDYMKWEKEGQEIVGAFISKAAIPSRQVGKTYYQYLFHTDAGNIKFALGTSADNDFSERFYAGVVYVITYKGKGVSAAGNEFNIFEVSELETGDYGEVAPETPQKGDKS